MCRQRLVFRLILPIVFISLIIQACVEDVEPNITPVAELVFNLKDEAGNPVAGATVYLFPFQSSYDEYKADNQNGLSTSAPNVAAENVATSDAEGRAFFPARDLQGNGFASGNRWVYRPNSIYVRAELLDGNDFLTNDDDSTSTRIAFGELESGEVITVTTEVLMR
ncbi:MAG: hypothetical protein AAF696_01595 [Bacteroidota bacterium]